VLQQEDDVGFMAQEIGEVALRAEDQRESGRVRRLIADSGTTTTMVNSVEGLHDVVYRRGRVLTAGGVIESVAEGKMRVKVLDTRGRVGRLYINRVVVIPSLARGLFSVTQAAQQGARMVLDVTSGWLVWDTIQVQLEREGRLYVLQVELEGEDESGLEPPSGKDHSTEPADDEAHLASAAARDLAVKLGRLWHAKLAPQCWGPA
jgi:hypothetical protein